MFYVIRNRRIPDSGFFFNDTATTEIYTLSLHDALPILGALEPAHDVGDRVLHALRGVRGDQRSDDLGVRGGADRKSTRLNSSHANISYAVFCLKKKKHLVSATILYHMKPLLRPTHNTPH